MTHAARNGTFAEKVRFVAVYYSAEACDLLGVRNGAGSADQDAHSSTGQAAIVGSLGGTGAAGAAGAAGENTGSFF